MGAEILNGTKSRISVSKFPWKDVYGETIGVIGISGDISKHKKLENHILRTLSIFPLIWISRLSFHKTIHHKNGLHLIICNDRVICDR